MKVKLPCLPAAHLPIDPVCERRKPAMAPFSGPSTTTTETARTHLEAKSIPNQSVASAPGHLPCRGGTRTGSGLPAPADRDTAEAQGRREPADIRIQTHCPIRRKRKTWGFVPPGDWRTSSGTGQTLAGCPRVYDRWPEISGVTFTRPQWIGGKPTGVPTLLRGIKTARGGTAVEPWRAGLG